MHPLKRLAHTFAATLFIYGVLVLFYLVPNSFQIIRPISTALGDFELTDILFSQLRDENPTADTNVVIVDIDPANRMQVAGILDWVSKGKPAGMGLMGDFSEAMDDEGDLALKEVLRNTPNVVYSARTVVRNKETGGSVVKTPHLKFSPFLKIKTTGLTPEDKKLQQTTREFRLYEKTRDNGYNSMALELAQKLAPEEVKVLKARNKETELINFSRKQMNYMSLDAPQAIEAIMANTDPTLLFVNKIVLLGPCIRENEDPMEYDKYFTPMNSKYAGKARPDMYEAEIQANIISMILEENYINRPPMWINLVLGLLIVLVNVAIFHYINLRFSSLYDVVTKAIQLVISILMLYAQVIIFHNYSLKIDLSIGVAALLLGGDALEIYLGIFRSIFGSEEDEGPHSNELANEGNLSPKMV